MSFILDALKRAERDRRLGKSPDLSSVVGDGDPPRRRRWVGVAVVAALVLNCVGLAAWFWLRAEPPSHAVAQPPQAATAAVPESPAPPGAAVRRPEPRLPRPTAVRGEGSGTVPATRSAAPVATRGSPPGAVGRQARDAGPPTPVLPVEPERQAADLGGSRPAVGSTAPPAAVSTPGTDRPKVDPPVVASTARDDSAAPTEEDVPPAEVPGTGTASAVRPAPPVVAPASKSQAAAPESPRARRLRDLPLEVRGRLEELVIEGHVYSHDPGKRFVFVDGRTVRVGERIGDTGPLVVEITVEGVIVDFGGGLAALPASP